MFHATTALYLLSMDLLYALKLIEVLIVRTDLLWAHYRGLGIQFFTVWSQVSSICSNLCSYVAILILLAVIKFVIPTACYEGYCV